jgi:hypothetical protein
MLIIDGATRAATPAKNVHIPVIPVIGVIQVLAKLSKCSSGASECNTVNVKYESSIFYLMYY